MKQKSVGLWVEKLWPTNHIQPVTKNGLSVFEEQLQKKKKKESGVENIGGLQNEAPNIFHLDLYGKSLLTSALVDEGSLPGGSGT